MRIAANQSYLFPYIGFFQLINAVDKFIVYDNLNFRKKSWINRNNILMRNNNVLMIKVPIKHKSSYTKIRDIEIDSTNKTWRSKLLKILDESYHKSPMYNEVFPILEKTINYPAEKLSELNSHSTVIVCNYLRINTLIETVSSKYLEIENLLSDENYFSESYKDVDRRTIRIIEMCRKEQADVFLNAIGGEKLYSKELFKKYNIRLLFLRAKDISYKQYKHCFIPNLSIIDVMMFNSIEKIQELLCEYELI